MKNYLKFVLYAFVCQALLCPQPSLPRRIPRAVPPLAQTQKLVNSIKKKHKLILFCPETNLREPLLELINKEKKAIYIAQYRITDKEITNALIQAHKRGVKIECITDISCQRERSNTLKELSDYGIPVFIYNIAWRIMHLKLWLFRKNDYGSYINWTGSANATRAGLLTNQENALIWQNKEDFYEYISQFKGLKNFIKNRKLRSREEIEKGFITTIPS